MISINSYLDCPLKLLEDKSQWCKDEDVNGAREICDGTKNNCISKGLKFCEADPNCHGIMWNDGWGATFKGVRLCTSSALIYKPGRDWETHLKRCKEGNILSFKNQHLVLTNEMI